MQNSYTQRGFKSHELSAGDAEQIECLEIGITSRCNFHCAYCTAYDKNSGILMSAEAAFEVIASVPMLKRVKLSGGEVLLRFEDCVRIVRHCSDKGIETQINTNGSVLNEAKISALESAGLNYLHFSLNFCDAESHSRYYKVPKWTFQTIVANIRRATHGPIQTIVETIIFSDTDQNMPALIEYIHSLGVRHVEVQNGVPQNATGWNQTSDTEGLRTAVRDIIRSRKSDLNVYFSCVHLVPDGDFHAEVAEEIGKGGVYFPACIEGRRQLHIHSNGDVLVCELGQPTVIGNVFQGTRLQEILRNKPKPLAEFLEKGECACAVKV